MLKMGKRSKREIERDNINYLLSKNADIIKKALEKYDKYAEQEEELGIYTFEMQKVDLEGGRFSFHDKSYQEVITELTRLQDFLASPKSSIEKAKTQQQRFIDIFKKGNWDKELSPKKLDEEVAKRAYRAYRNIEAHRAAEIVGVGGYESDNFISYLYSMEVQGYDSQIYGENLLDQVKKDKFFGYEEIEDSVFIPRNVTRASLRQKRRNDLYEREF